MAIRNADHESFRQQLKKLFDHKVMDRPKIYDLSNSSNKLSFPSNDSYSLFHKKRYAFSQKVSKIFILFFYVMTVRSRGCGATTDSFQSCSKCQILHNIKLWVLSTLNVTKRFFCAPMLPKCLKSRRTSCKCGYSGIGTQNPSMTCQGKKRREQRPVRRITGCTVQAQLNSSAAWSQS